VNHPDVNASFPCPGLPFKFANLVKRSGKRAPLIGEHNTEIFQRELGFSEKEIQSLSSEGII